MTPKRAALLERFRARSRERIAALRLAVRGAAPRDESAWTALMGDLHTLKGESRMLGLISMASLAHAVEERLAASEDAAGVDGALGRIDAMLASELAESAQAERLASEGMGLLTGDPRETGATSAIVERPETTRPEAITQAQTRARIVDVPAESLDALCREVETVRAALARAVLRGGLDKEAAEELLSRVTRVGEDAWGLCLAPVTPALAALAAHAEELGAAQGKQLRVLVDAEGAALERGVLDALAEPLLHLVRNAIDHGIEAPSERASKDATARLTLAAEPHADAVTLVVSDDGRGIDAEAVVRAAVAKGRLDRVRASELRLEEKLDLVFAERVSTRETVSDVSGRGIGLEVVRRVAESMGGSVTVSSVLGRGTEFRLTVPVALTRERILLVGAGALWFGISARYVASVVALEGNVEQGPAGDLLRTENGEVPIRPFAKLVGVTDATVPSHAIVVRVHDRLWALAVPTLGGERDVLRRPADAALRAFGIVSASAVLDDGRAVLLPTVADLLRRTQAAGSVVARATATRAPSRQRHALVVDDSPVVRELVAELLVTAGFKVNQAENGEDALARMDGCAFDVIVSDVEMPRCDGLELVRRVRARGIHTPIVMVTTRGSAEDRERAAALGANGYVVKTEFHESELVAVVRRLAEAPA